MSNLSIIRKLTSEDRARVQKASERFCQRHGIGIDPTLGDDAAKQAIEYWLHDAHPEDKAYRRQLWMRVYCRALKVPYDVRTTTGWSYIGLAVD